MTQANCNGAWTTGGTCSPNLCAPLNDDCNNRAGLGLGTQAFDTTNATTDGPAHALCLNSGDNQVAKDIWFNHPASITGTLDIDTCGSSFDTKIAVYSGTGCADYETRLIACNDDATCPTGPGLQSKLTINIVAGMHYTIRIGGFNNAAGVGQVTLTATATPTGSCCITDGSCTVTTQASCTGAWTTGGTCSPNACPQPTGACCDATTCSITTQAACTGAFQGVGTVCGAVGNSDHPAARPTSTIRAASPCRTSSTSWPATSPATPAPTSTAPAASPCRTSSTSSRPTSPAAPADPRNESNDVNPRGARSNPGPAFVLMGLPNARHRS